MVYLEERKGSKCDLERKLGPDERVSYKLY